MFAGSARALLASMIFAFETTLQPHGLLPLLAGCSSAYLVSSLMMRNTIMTEKIARRGVNVPSEYAADFLIQILVKECATKNVVSIKAEDEVSKVRKWLASGEEGTLHHAYPVIDEYEKLIGIIRRRELENQEISGDKKIMEIVQGPLIAIYEDNSMREAADMMARYKVTRIPIIAHDDHQKLIGLISHDDILNVRRMHNEKENLYKRYISLSKKRKKDDQNKNGLIKK